MQTKTKLALRITRYSSPHLNLTLSSMEITRKEIRTRKIREGKRRILVESKVDSKLKLELLHCVLLETFIKMLESSSIQCKIFASGLTRDCNCTRRVNISNHKRTYPSRTQLTRHQLESGIVEEDFLSN